MKANCKKMIVGLVLSALASSAFAGFEVVEAEKPQGAPVMKMVDVTKAKKNANDVSQTQLTDQSKRVQMAKSLPIMIGGLTHVGHKPAILPPAKGFAKNLTLKDALSMLVPQNFEIYNDGQVNLNSLVSWNGSDADDWAGVLSNLMRVSQIAATIDWTAHTLTLDKQVIAEKKPVVPVFKMLASDKTVRGTIQRWSKDAGWHTDWDVAVDFPVPYDIEFTGNFEAAVGEVIKSLSASDYPIQACSYENNILRVIRFGEQQRCTLN